MDTGIASILCNVKILRQILFHFQRRINVISALIHNLETMLIDGDMFGIAYSLQDVDRFLILPTLLV